jgi:hypothetical protein
MLMCLLPQRTPVASHGPFALDVEMYLNLRRNAHSHHRPSAVDHMIVICDCCHWSIHRFIAHTFCLYIRFAKAARYASTETCRDSRVSATFQASPRDSIKCPTHYYTRHQDIATLNSRLRVPHPESQTSNALTASSPWATFGMS